MRKIPVRNYFYLLVILVVSVLVVINIATMYKLNKRVETEFYTYSNNISGKEFENYITEYPDAIIYIYDKYSIDYQEFERELREKIDKLSSWIVSTNKRRKEESRRDGESVP